MYRPVDSLVDHILEMDELREIFIVQEYSMRNYVDNKYDIHSDGNFMTTLHRLKRLNDELEERNAPVVNVTITVPNLDKIKDSISLANVYLIGDRININFIKCDLYDIDIHTTRTLFANEFDVNQFFDIQFTNVKGSVLIMSMHCHSYESMAFDRIYHTFNVSKVESINRSYLQDYSKVQYLNFVKCMNERKEFCVVLNLNQIDWFHKTYKEMFETSLKIDKVIYDKRLIYVPTYQLIRDIIEKRFHSLLDEEGLPKFLTDRLTRFLVGEVGGEISDLGRIGVIQNRLNDKLYRSYESVEFSLDENEVTLLTNPNFINSDHVIEEFDTIRKLVEQYPSNLIDLNCWDNSVSDFGAITDTLGGRETIEFLRLKFGWKLNFYIFADVSKVFHHAPFEYFLDKRTTVTFSSDENEDYRIKQLMYERIVQ